MLPTISPEISALYQKKSRIVLDRFSDCKTPESLYERLIEIGKSLPRSSKRMTEIDKEPYRIRGCQSTVFLFSEQDASGKIRYEIESDALISSGLAALLFLVYQGEEPLLILLCPPVFLEELRLNSLLSPGRSGGLFSLYSKMKQDALKLFLSKKESL